MDRYENMKEMENDFRINMGFWSAVLSLIIVYAASAAPIPLYSAYREIIGLTSADLSMSAVMYFFGTGIALLMFARISNYVGRKPMIFVTMGMALLACLMFFYIESAMTLLFGRFVQGVSCGMASSCIAAYVIDTTPKKYAWLGVVFTSAGPMAGLAIGSFGAGALRQYCTGSLFLIFEILIMILAGCLILLVLSPETVVRNPGGWRSIVPQIRVPQNIRPLIPAASATFVGTWAIGGFYQAFSSSIALEQLGTSNTMIAAAVFSGMMAPSLLGSSLAGRMKEPFAQRIGMSVFLISFIWIIISLKMRVVVSFLIAGVFAGTAWGIAFTGSMKRLLNKTSQEDRAGVLSTIFLISYCGAAIPSLIVGRISSMFNLYEISIGYGIVVAIATIITIFTANEN